MSQVTLQGGKVVIRDGQVGTEQACCCCDLSNGDVANQPSVTVTTNCLCEVGTLDGEYSYDGVGFFGFTWSGESTCDADAFGVFFAPFSVSVNNNCTVAVSTYQLGQFGVPQGLIGSISGAGLLSVDENGKIVGTVTVPLESFNGIECSATLVFGP